MKKLIVVLATFILVSAISMAMIRPAKAYVNAADWRPPYVYYESGYYGEVVYEDGATASLWLSITNDHSPTIIMNVSKVIIEFYQIAENETLDLLANPHQLMHDETEIFTVNFQVDGTKFISGFEFDYNVIVEWVNATAGPMKVVDYWEFNRYWDLWTPPFEVYPATQADAEDSRSKYDTYYSNFPSWYWESVLGEQKYAQAIIEKDLGDTYYDRGNYASALTQYNKANTLFEEALAAEFAYRDTDADAKLNVTLSEAAVNLKTADAALIEANAAMVTANATKAQSDAAIINAYGWYFIGIGFALGWSFMGIGVIIYAWRRPKPPV